MDFDLIMRELGADRHPLSESQRRQIDRDGYLVLPEVFSRAQVATMRAELDRLVVELGCGVTEWDGGYRIHDLIGRPEFDLAWSHPQLLAVARYWLRGEFKPMSLNYRCPLPGSGQQALHS